VWISDQGGRNGNGWALPCDAVLPDADDVKPGPAFDRRALLRTSLAGAAAVLIGAKVLAETGPEPAASAAGASEEEPAGHGDESDAAPPPAIVVPPPPIVRRAEWKANEALRRKATYDGRIERIVVHHTATWPSDLDFPAHVRKIYENEIASGYRDIAYHLLIDPNGVIYEGRWARNVEAGETPDGENSRGRSIRGGHARSNNDRTLGFAIIGDYSGVSPTDQAIASLVHVLAWKCARWSLDPHGQTLARADDGTEITRPTIVGHGDLRVTVCPGEPITERLPEFRDRAAAVIAEAS
jgi:hypothetical protein